MSWRRKLEALIRNGTFRRQSELVEALAESGVAVTQSSVSRELSALGIVKVDGYYAMPSGLDAPAPIHDVAFTNGGCLGVIRTDPAFAAVVGQFIDESRLECVLGTISGDDTVFVALREDLRAEPLLELLGWEN